MTPPAPVLNGFLRFCLLLNPRIGYSQGVLLVESPVGNGIAGVYLYNDTPDFQTVQRNLGTDAEPSEPPAGYATVW